MRKPHCPPWLEVSEEEGGALSAQWAGLSSSRRSSHPSEVGLVGLVEADPFRELITRPIILTLLLLHLHGGLYTRIEPGQEGAPESIRTGPDIHVHNKTFVSFLFRSICYIVRLKKKIQVHPIQLQKMRLLI